jgi:hypothetical protein
MKKKLPHKMPSDFQSELNNFPKAVKAWETVTPLAQNEFMCWILDAKKEETRHERIERAIVDLMEGKRRPCCWIGCIHRKDKEISPSVKGILEKNLKNSLV